MIEKTSNHSETSAKPAPDAAGPQAAPIRLWLVDDNQRFRRTLAEILSLSSGIECTRDFPSPDAVLSTLASKPGPDVILLDIEMGSQNGLDAVRPIKSLARDTRVFMLTTFFDSHSRTRALEDGASGFLLKCYPVEEIIQSIRQRGATECAGVRRRTKSTNVARASTAGEVCVNERRAPEAKDKVMFKRWLGALKGFVNLF